MSHGFAYTQAFNDMVDSAYQVLELAKKSWKRCHTRTRKRYYKQDFTLGFGDGVDHQANIYIGTDPWPSGSQDQRNHFNRAKRSYMFGYTKGIQERTRGLSNSSNIKLDF